MPIEPTIHSAPENRQHRQLDLLVDDLSRLARSESTEKGFYTALIQGLLQATASAAAGVWKMTADGPALILSAGANVALLAPDGVRQEAAELLRNPPNDHRPANGLLIRQSEGGVLLAPVTPGPLRHAARTASVLSILPSESGSAGVRAGCSRLLEALSQIAAEFERNQRFVRVENELASRQALDALRDAVTGSATLQEAVWQLVQRTRSWLGCDRVTLALRNGSRFAVTAVSGVDRLERRSDAVQHLERLACSAAALTEDFWFAKGTDVRSITSTPELMQRTEQELDFAGAAQLGLLPLAWPDAIHDPFALLIAERFSDPFERSQQEKAARLRTAIAFPLGLRLVHEADWIGRWFGRSSRRAVARSVRSRGLMAAIAAAIITLFLLWPIRFTVTARGELQPAERRPIFAPDDGIVTNLAVRHGDQVARGEVIAELESAELAAELVRVRGAEETIAAQLAAAELNRVRDRLPPDAASPDQERPAAQIEELRTRRDSLRRQAKILEQQIADLTVRSPIAGQIITFGLTDRLSNRPVRRGQILMRVADLKGDWELRLQVPERAAGHVQEAAATDSAPDLEFLLANDPGRTYHTRLGPLALSAEMQQANEGVTVEALARVPAGTLQLPRPGAAVIASVHCGRRARGYVWFHELIDAARTRFLLEWPFGSEE